VDIKRYYVCAECYEVHDYNMTSSHPLNIISLIFVVGVSVVVSGHLGLHAFTDDAVYVSNCRHGRCAGGLTYHRLPSSLRGRDRFSIIDDMVGDAGAKRFDEADYDDETVGRFRQIEDDRRITTFPYCSTMSVGECRSLLRRLERLRLRQLRGVAKRNVVVRGDDGTVVRLVGRRRRSVDRPTAGDDNGKSEAPKTRVARSHSGNAAFEAHRLLDQYRAWRRENGYGRNFARWGRSLATDSEENGKEYQYSDNASNDKDSLMTANNNNNTAKEVHTRTPRSVVVEIEPDEELPASERDMLDTYLAWRETHGYGTLAGRWG